MTNFLEFRNKKVYTKSSEKQLDFLFGFFMALIIMSPLLLIHFAPSPFIFIFLIVIAHLLFNKRKYIVYGVSFTILSAFIIGFVSALFLE